ncbi:hypothetical protein, partial [Rhodopirellula sallentina]|uniref:hypothetical protein n=1 Tax=Rhodopirellula sallentina TaxID=1263869 RepID=UPI001F442319
MEITMRIDERHDRPADRAKRGVDADSSSSQTIVRATTRWVCHAHRPREFRPRIDTLDLHAPRRITIKFTR